MDDTAAIDVVSQTMGMGGAFGPAIDLGSFRLTDSDIVLLCTNGLTDAVADDLRAQYRLPGAGSSSRSSQRKTG